MQTHTKLTKIALQRTVLTTMIRREILRFFRLWQQTLLPPLITSCLYFIVFGRLLGTHIKVTQVANYSTYIAPGLIMMHIMTNAYANTSYSLCLNRFNKNIEEMLIAPISNTILIAGHVTGGVIRGLCAGAEILLVARCFTHVPIQHPILTLVVMLLSALLLSLAGFTNGLLAKDYSDLAIIPTFILTPLIYLGGVFYSVHQLPIAWQSVTYCNPIFFIINGFRYAMLNVSDIKFGLALLMLCGLIVVVLIINLFLLHKGVNLRR